MSSQPCFFPFARQLSSHHQIYSTTKTGSETPQPPSVASHPIHAPGEFHYTGKFAPFDEEPDDAIEDSVSQRRRLLGLESEPTVMVHECREASSPLTHLFQHPFIGSLIDNHAFEDPRPAPRPRTLPFYDTAGFICQQPPTVASASDTVITPPFSSPREVFPRGIEGRKEGEDSENNLSPIREEYGDGVNPSYGSLQARRLYYQFPSTLFSEEDCNRVHDGSRGSSPKAIATHDIVHMNITDRDIPVPHTDLRHRPQDGLDFPFRKIHSPALTAVKDMRPAFTNPFDGNKEIDFRVNKTPSGGDSVIYSTDRAWNARYASKPAAFQTMRTYLGSDKGAVHIPLGEVVRDLKIWS